MISITPDAQAQAIKRLGTQPVPVVEINWDKTLLKRYSGNTLFNSEAKLLTLSEITTTKSDIFDIIETASCTLSDSDGTLKQIFDTYILEGSPVSIYHCFANLTESDKVLILSGKVTAPIEWSESERTLTLNFISRFEDKVVSGLDENDLEDEDCTIKQPPMVFGTCYGVPISKTTCTPVARTLDSIWQVSTAGGTGSGAIIVTNSPNFRVHNGHKFPKGQITLLIDGALFVGQFGVQEDIDDDVFFLNDFNVAFGTIRINPRQQNDMDYANPNCVWGDTNIPWLQGKYIVYTYTSNKSYITFEGEKYPVPAGTIGASTGGSQNLVIDSISTQSELKFYLGHAPVGISGEPYCLGQNGDGSRCVGIYGKYPLYMANTRNSLQYDFPPFWEIPPGANVELYQQQVYYINWLPTTSILGVYAIRNNAVIGLPGGSYSINMTTPAKLTLVAPLSYYGQFDGDDIYVSLTSSIGPNIVDIIQYLIETYTDITCDSTSFTTVKNQDSVKNYPACFALLEARTIFELLKDITWQARLILSIQGSTAYLSNPMVQSSSVYTLSNTNAEFGSYSLKTTDTTDIITKFIGKYNETYFSIDDPNKITLFNNVDIFNKRNFEKDFWIYNQRSCVKKAMEYWMNQRSNVWYILTAKTFLTSLAIVVGDAVTLDVPYTIETYGIVIDKQFDVTDSSITLTIWIPQSNSGGIPWLTYDDTLRIDVNVISYNFQFGNFFFWSSAMQYHPPKALTFDASQQEHEQSNPASISNRQAQVTHIDDNYLTCKFISPVDSADPVDLRSSDVTCNNQTAQLDQALIIVALPTEFRKNCYDGKTINEVSYTFTSYATGLQQRSALKGTTLENQVISPPYWEGGIIDIEWRPKGCGLNDADVTSMYGLVVWQDKNTAARAWGVPANE
jgi:hypothetical protein